MIPIFKPTASVTYAKVVEGMKGSLYNRAVAAKSRFTRVDIDG